jgi:non-specific serine/threonine protein kinase
MHFKTDGSGIDKINIINTLMRLQLSNHPKMIEKNQNLIQENILVTRYLKP